MDEGWPELTCRGNASGPWAGDFWALRLPGDVLHDVETLHARAKSDACMQIASEPVDDRWIGEDPPALGIRNAGS